VVVQIKFIYIKLASQGKKRIVEILSLCL